MKFIVLSLFVLSGSWSSAVELNKNPPKPPSLENFLYQMEGHISFVRTCAFLALTNKPYRVENGDQTVLEAKMLLQNKLQEALATFHQMAINPPFFKSGNGSFTDNSASAFKSQWNTYLGTLFQQGQNLLQATAGLPASQEVESFHTAFFTMFYRVLTAAAKVQIHVKEPWWVLAHRYPAQSHLFERHEIYNDLNMLDFLQTNPNEFVLEEQRQSLNAYLKTFEIQGGDNFTVQNHTQFYILIEFWEGTPLPAEEANKIATLKNFEDAVAYRAEKGVPGCAEMLRDLRAEKNN